MTTATEVGTMTARPPTEEARRNFYEVVERTYREIARRRAFADHLVRDDGSVEARNRAKSLRIRMSLWERQTRLMVEYIEATPVEAVSA